MMVIQINSMDALIVNKKQDGCVKDLRDKFPLGLFPQQHRVLPFVEMGLQLVLKCVMMGKMKVLKMGALIVKLNLDLFALLMMNLYLHVLLYVEMAI